MNSPAIVEGSEQRSSLIQSLSDFSKQHRAARWAGTFSGFLDSVFPADPKGIARSSHQYVWDMMQSRQGLFQQELFGVEETIGRVEDYFKAASAGSEVGRRLLLLLGPPSGGKSSMVILLKRGLEEYSLTDEGAMYALQGSPMHESPLNLIPASLRGEFRETYGVEIRGDLSPWARDRLERAIDRLEIRVVGRARRHRDVQVRARSGTFAGLVRAPEEERVLAVGVGMDRRIEHLSPAPEDLLRPVAVVNVVVDDRHPREAARARVRRRHGNVVEQAEAHRTVPFGVMARRAHHHERPRARAPVQHVIDCGNRRARRQPRHVVRVGRRERVRVQCDGAPCRFPDQPDVLAIVNPTEIFVGCRPRLDHGASAPAELGGDDLHDLRALDPLRVARRRQMIRPAIGREESEHSYPHAGESLRTSRARARRVAERPALPHAETAASRACRSSAAITRRLRVAR